MSYFESLVQRYQPPRLPHLLERQQYIQHERQGVTSLLISSDELSQQDNEDLLRFAFVHYAAVGFLNESLAEQLALECEPVDSLTAEDIHCIVLNSMTGELLAYCNIKKPVNYRGLMGDPSRPLLATENAWGRAAFRNIPWLEFLPVRQVREVGRVVRNGWLRKNDPLAVRSVSEMLLAAFEYLQTPGSDAVAIIGDGEKNIQIRNLLALGVNYCFAEVGERLLPPDHLYYPRYFADDLLPFAFRLSDMDCSALAWFNQALEMDNDTWLMLRTERMAQVTEKLSHLTKELITA